MVEFFEFEWGEFGLCWSASSEDVDVGGLVGFEGLVDVVWDFGGVEFVGGFGEDAGDVEGDVADSDDGDVGGGEVPGAVESGVAVVEAYEVCCAVGSVEVFAGDVEVAVGNSAGGEDDGVVVFVQLFDGDGGADLDIAEEPHVGFLHDGMEGIHDSFNAGMVGGDAVADEAKRCGHLLKQVDFHGAARLHE